MQLSQAAKRLKQGKQYPWLKLLLDFRSHSIQLITPVKDSDKVLPINGFK